MILNTYDDHNPNNKKRQLKAVFFCYVAFVLKRSYKFSQFRF